MEVVSLNGEDPRSVERGYVRDGLLPGPHRKSDKPWKTIRFAPRDVECKGAGRV